MPLPSGGLQARIAAFESGQPIRAPDSPPPTPPPLLAQSTHIAIVPASAPASPHLASARIVKPPPLPPRKPSLASLKNANSAVGLRPGISSPPLPLAGTGRSASDSLDVHGYSYPSTGDRRAGAKGHQHAASTSSFQSVSLESDNGTPDRDIDNHSLDGSLESVPSSFSMPTDTSPSNSPPSDNVGFFSAAKPKLPPRPPKVKSPSPSSPVAAPARRPAPPPPLKLKSSNSSLNVAATPVLLPSQQIAHWRDNASTSSSSTRTSSKPSTPTTVATRRPTPVPAAARARYDAVFERNLAVQQTVAARRAQRNRRQEGWRGLSIDWNDGSGSSGAGDGSDARLRRHIVKTIWSWSRLPDDKLKEIWYVKSLWVLALS